MFIVFLSLIDYFNFSKFSHGYKDCIGQNGIPLRFYRAFVVSSIQSRKIRELLLNFCELFRGDEKHIRGFLRHYKMNAANVSSGGTTHDSTPR